MSLRDRCKEFYQSQGRNAMLRQGDPVQDIRAWFKRVLWAAINGWQK